MTDSEEERLFGDEDTFEKDPGVDLDDLLNDSIQMATQAVELFGDDDDTLPPTNGIPAPIHFGSPVEFLSQLSPEQPRLALRCPLCTGFSTKGPVRGLMLHMTTRHCGAAIDNQTCSTLHGLERGLCINCGCIRASRSPSCHRCSSSAPPRHVKVGDSIQGTRWQERNLDAAGFERSLPHADVRSLPTGNDRVLFLSEVRKLPCNTEIHIPVSVRDRFADILAGLLERISKNDVDACFLEEV